jgi:hypothetical protein
MRSETFLPSRLLMLFALLTGLGASAGAAAAVPVAMVEQVLSLDQQLHALERAADPAGTTEFTIFVGSQRNELRLRRITVRVDQLAPVAYEYAAAEWEALAAGGLHPAWNGALTPGAHRLQVELYARVLEPTRNDAQIVHRVDETIEIAAGDSLELSLAQRRFGRSEVLLHRWTDAGPSTPSEVAIEHPWLRAGQFWRQAQRPYHAARLLRRAQSRAAGAGWAAEASAMAAASVRELADPMQWAARDQYAVEAFDAALLALGQGNPAPLQVLAEIEADSETAWMRRDHANLLLGYHVLRQGDGEGARQWLSRIRSPGPYGNLGLLGFGWSFLQTGAPPAATPATDPALPADQPTFVTAAHAPGLRRDEDRREALQRALVPWTELIGRDPLDPAAQEGALALAWALHELDTGTQAYTYYERAAGQLERAQNLLDQAARQVRSGALADFIAAGQNDTASGWRPWLADLPYEDDKAFLGHLLREPEFIRALDRYRGPRLLHDRLLDCQRRLQALAGGTPHGTGASSTLSAGIAHGLQAVGISEQAARNDLDRVALNLLQAWRLRTQRYLGEARLALARHFDHGLEPEVEIRREPAPETAS